MYPALQSCIMQDYSDRSQLYVNAQQEHVNSYPYSCEQYHQRNHRNTMIYKELFHTNSPHVQHGARSDSYVTDNSLQMYNLAAYHSLNQMPATRINTKPTLDVKPPYSYAALICMAIESDVEKKATMPEIIHYIQSNFAYYRSQKKWHGTIRHDLTVNDCFTKLSPRPGQKACLWAIDPQFQDMFCKGNFRRRRYRFKKGSNSWLKARKQSADKQHQNSKHIDRNSLQPTSTLPDTSLLQCALRDVDNTESSLTGLLPPDDGVGFHSETTATSDDLNEYFHSDTTSDQNDYVAEYQATIPELKNVTGQENISPNDSLPNIPDFQDCVDELYRSFQNDYFMSM